MTASAPSALAPRPHFPNMIRPAPETDAAITLRNVEKRFGGTRAVSGLDLVVPRGSLCGFLGPNGAGKSTTIRMIMSIIYPDSGSVRVLDDTALANKDRIGYLPEERGLYRTMRVGEFLVYLGRLKGLTAAAAHRNAGEWLERIDLRGIAKKKCQELSKGMQQKVQFIASVIHDPELLILDEPFSGLDPVNTHLLTGIIQELNRSGKTIIFSTHQMYTAEAMCDRVVLINHGTKLLDATLSEVRAQFEPREIQFEPVDETLPVERVLAVPGVEACAPDAFALDEPAVDSGADEERPSRPLPQTSTYPLTVRAADGHDPQRVMHTILSTFPTRMIALKRPTLNDVFFQLVHASGGTAPALSNIPQATGG